LTASLPYRLGGFDLRPLHDDEGWGDAPAAPAPIARGNSDDSFRNQVKLLDLRFP